MNAISFKTLRPSSPRQEQPGTSTSGLSGSDAWGLFASLLLCIGLFVGGVIWRTHLQEQSREVTRRIQNCKDEIQLLNARQRIAIIDLSREQSSEALQRRLNRSPSSVDLRKRDPNQVRIPSMLASPPSTRLPASLLQRSGRMISSNP